MKRLVVVIGKTFSGKSSFLRNEMKNYHKVKTHTTRPVRETESGNEYYFEKYNDYVGKRYRGETLSVREYHTVYGTWAYWFEKDDLIDGRNVMILDLVGAKELEKNKDDDIIIDYIYINTSIKDIKNRIRNSDRGKTESKDETSRRLKSDIKEHEVLDALSLKNGVVDITGFIQTGRV